MDKLTEPAESPGLGPLLDTPDLALALESDVFKQFLDQVPVAIAVSVLEAPERVVYANLEFQRLAGEVAAKIIGQSWELLHGVRKAAEDNGALSRAITEDRDYLGIFAIDSGGAEVMVDAWSNVIEDDDGQPAFRLAALVERALAADEDRAGLEQRIQDKDTLLLELQHRVKNNLQMITSLIRVEARGLPDGASGERFDRLAGRVEALGLLYRSLTESGPAETVDLGVYLSQIASAVMHAHAVEGIHLDLQVDTWPVSVNVAMPAGLVVNELLTNALKHAFDGRDGGTIKLHASVDPSGCRVLVADDGVGLPLGVAWPKTGKLSALIVRSLVQNAKARIDVESEPGQGMSVTIIFANAEAPPSA